MDSDMEKVMAERKEAIRDLQALATKWEGKNSNVFIVAMVLEGAIHEGVEHELASYVQSWAITAMDRLRAKIRRELRG